MHHNHIENIAESIGKAQAVLETLSAYRYSSGEEILPSSEDKQILNEYAQGWLINAMEQLWILSNQLNQ